MDVEAEGEEERQKRSFLRSLLGFEALTAAVMKNSIFCDITSRSPCSPLKISRRFGRICIHLQGHVQRYIPEDRTLLKVAFLRYLYEIGSFHGNENFFVVLLVVAQFSLVGGVTNISEGPVASIFRKLYQVPPILL
jgi:hypothetical protein